MVSSSWEISRISQILPLDEETLQQILDYTSTLSRPAAAEHLKGILGDTPPALEFISNFNSRREVHDRVVVAAESTSPSSASPSRPAKARKKKPPLNNLPPPRVPEDHGNTSGACSKREEEDYISGARRSRKELPAPNAFKLSEPPIARQTPTGKLPPSASGPLILDLPHVHTSSSTSKSNKIHVSGGSSMHGASTTLRDLDSAIRTLELQTNPSLSSSPSARRCDCLATRHPLLAAAPNCLNCGKIICVKEGLGPCTFCSHPLLSSQDITSMIRALREERGVEKTSINNAAYRRADIAQTPRPFTTPPPPPLPPSPNQPLLLALQHRNNLLTFQRDNAQRTQIIDEAADFETPTLSLWSTPLERAAQLKRQQKVLREQEWNAKPEYEKRNVVVSIDLVGGKVVRKMAPVVVDRGTEDGDGDEESGRGKGNGNENGVSLSLNNSDPYPAGTGTFRSNPLLGALIRPVWKPTNLTNQSQLRPAVPSSSLSSSPQAEPQAESKGEWKGEEWKGEWKAKVKTWRRRRVQDDNGSDNEAWILDGGVYGTRA